MTDTFGDPNEPQAKTVTMSRKDIKRLEEQAKAGREAKERLAQLERERAFVQAGVPLDDKRTPYFIAGYQGKDDPEAIKAAWTEAFGGDGGQPTGGQPDPMSEELARLQAAQDLVGAMPDISSDKLAERNQKLAALSQSDPHYSEKFDAIFMEYGGKRGGLVG